MSEEIIFEEGEKSLTEALIKMGYLIPIIEVEVSPPPEHLKDSDKRK